MIARIWRGRTRAEDGDAYVEYVNETGVAQHRQTPGNRGSMILRREVGNEVEFLVFSLWESLDAVRAFAGERPEVAVYYPEDEKFLLALEPEVHHYEVAVADLA
jgi:heme-degrading monooxygenase HmoA